LQQVWPRDRPEYWYIPFISTINGLPHFAHPCWVHVIKNIRASILNGSKPSATADQQQLFQEFLAMVENTKEVHLSIPEMRGLDLQNFPTCLRMFSQESVTGLRDLGHTYAATLCFNVAQFAHALDVRGNVENKLDMDARCNILREVKAWLLDGIDVFKVDSHVKGMSWQTWESTIVCIDSFLQLRKWISEVFPGDEAFLNPRSINNDDSERFFGVMLYQTKASFIRKLALRTYEAYKRADADKPYYHVGGKRLTQNEYTLSGELMNDTSRPVKKQRGQGIPKKHTVNEGPATGGGVQRGVRAFYRADSKQNLPNGPVEFYEMHAAKNQKGDKIIIRLEQTVPPAPPIENTAARLSWEERVPQHTSEWHAMRHTVPPTVPDYSGRHPINGSSLKDVCGVGPDPDSVKRKKMAALHAWHRGAEGAEAPSIPDAVRPACEYGTKMEENGLATIVMRVLSKMGCDVTIREVGMHRLSGEVAFVAVTPDGVASVDGEVIVIEIKCPYYGKTGQSPESDSRCRAYYILQVHAEMVAVGAKRAYLVSWDQHSTVIFEIEFNAELWSMVKAWLVKWWAAKEPPAPCDETQAISERCEQIAAKATEKKMVVPSVRAARAPSN